MISRTKLDLTLFYCTILSNICLAMASPPTSILGLENFINSIESCQVYLIFDILNFGSPLTTPISIYKATYEVEYLEEEESTFKLSEEPKLDVVQARGFNCFFTIIYFSEELKRLDGENKERKPIKEVLMSSQKRLYFSVIQSIGTTYEPGSTVQYFISPHYANYLYVTRKYHWTQKWMFDLYLWLTSSGIEFRKQSGGFLINFIQEISVKTKFGSELLLVLDNEFSFLCAFCNAEKYPSVITLQSTIISRIPSGGLHPKYVFAADKKPAKWSLKNVLGFSSASDKILISLPNYNPNPFRIPKGQLILLDAYIIHLLFSYDNSSFEISDCGWSNFCAYFFPQIHAHANLDCGIGDGYMRSYCQNIFSRVATATETFSFLTCYSIPEQITFKKYLKPFHLDLWLALLTALLCISGCLHFFLKYIKYSGFDFNPYLFMFSSALEHSHGVPNILQAYFQVKIIVGLWLLISVIFTNAYKGIAIMEIISPIARESATHFENLTHQEVESSYDIFETFHDIHPPNSDDFKFLAKVKPKIYWKEFTKLSETYPDWSREALYTFREALMVLRMSVIAFYYGKNEPLLSHHRMYYNLILRDNFKEVPREDIEINNNNNGKPIRTWLSEDSAIEKELLRGEKTVYIDTTRKINLEFDYLSKQYQQHSNFFKTKEPIYEHNVGYVFDYPAGSNVPEYFSRLIHSGIYYHLEKHFAYQEYRERLNFTRKSMIVQGDRVEPIKLYSNIQTVFYLYFIGIGCCILYFAAQAEQVKSLFLRSLKIVQQSFVAASKYLQIVRLF